MEEEARRIISLAVSAPAQLGSLFVDTFGPENGVELAAPPRDEHEPMALGS
jgi:hypothetical protein